MPPKKNQLGRRTKAATTVRNIRASLDYDEVELLRSREAQRMSQTRSSETLTQRTYRLSRHAAAMAQLRSSQTAEIQANRRAANAASTSSARANESTERTARRRAANAASTASARAAESTEARVRRLARDNTSRAAIRSSQPPEARRIRVQAVTRRFNASRGNICPSPEFWLRKALNYDANYDFSTRQDLSIGSMNCICSFCKAKKWPAEPPSLCCSSGKVKLPSLQTLPQPLRDLLLGMTDESKYFRKSIRLFNCYFQMTSFGANIVRESGWNPAFKVQGQVYHLIGSLLPEDTVQPSFLQLYFVSDYVQQAENRLAITAETNDSSDRRQLSIVLQLQDMLHETNPYIQSFKYALQNVPLPNFSIVINADKRPTGEHERRFNAPTCNEVSAVIQGEHNNKRDIVIHTRGGGLQRIHEMHRSYDALQYPLLFPYGDDGYHFHIPCQQNLGQTTINPKTITCRAYYAYRLMVRDDDFNTLLRSGPLLQQYIVDMAAKMESERLLYIRVHQKQLRSSSYIHLHDGMRNESDPNTVGKLTILPSTYIGGPRYMHARTQDAMTYVRYYGRPDLFITFTCNPSWEEIRDELFLGQEHYDRPDLIARVFRLKLCKLMDLIVKGEVYGRVRCHIFTVEWQKRGLPHAHILIWLCERIQSTDIDKIISAEIPDPGLDPQLYEIVKATMVHGPCGPGQKAQSCCKKNSVCACGYPRRFVTATQTGGDGYPLYRRRSPGDGGHTMIVGRSTVDNRWIVPYCPLLTKIFQSHINVEFCHSVKSIKYICKYINKGSDAAAFAVQRDGSRDEPSAHVIGRFLCCGEGVWHFYSFPLHQRYPAVIQLAVHLENGQRVYFSAGTANQVVEHPPETTLTAFFKLCGHDEFAKTLLYPQIPSYYTWNNKQWTRRKCGDPVDGFPGVKYDSCLGRVYTVPPRQHECFHLRLLLHEVRGPISFDDIKTVDGVLCETFRDACSQLGLLENDSQWDAAMTEGSLFKSPHALRSLFAIMIVWCDLSDPKHLWMKFRNFMTEDISRRAQLENTSVEQDYSQVIYNEGLICLENLLLEIGGSTLPSYGLPAPIRHEGNSLSLNLLREICYSPTELTAYIAENEPKLLPEQLNVYHMINENVEQNRGGIFFLDAPGGTGKTFVTKLILAHVRRSGAVAIAVATSGIAATLLPDGRTAHSALKLPINYTQTEFPTCNIEKNSDKAVLFRRCKLIVWDECTMAHKVALEALNRTLQDLRNCDNIMGGLTVLLCGDFRQTLPVVPKGTRADAVQACLKSSILWDQVHHLKLTTNMRVHLSRNPDAANFSNALLELGEGRTPADSEDYTNVEHISTIVETPTHLYQAVFENIQKNYRDFDWLATRAILAPKNASVNAINHRLLELIPGEERVYKSIDRTPDTADLADYTVELLNSLEPPGLPPHILRLKVGAPIMLIRNLIPPKQCNGTRLVVTSLSPNIIEAKILTGCGKGETVLISRIPLYPSNPDLGIYFKRSQFPVKLCFAMSINKSQGQTFDVAGIHLQEQCFSHGQLYVAASRVGSQSKLFVFSPKTLAKNVVYKEVL